MIILVQILYQKALNIIHEKRKCDSFPQNINISWLGAYKLLIAVLNVKFGFVVEVSHIDRFGNLPPTVFNTRLLQKSASKVRSI